MLVWDPDRPGTDPIDLGRDDENEVRAIAVLSDGRIVTAGGSSSDRSISRSFGGDGRMLVWDPDQPGTDPIELGRGGDPVWTMAVLSDGRIVTGSGYDGGEGQVLVWDPDQLGTDPDRARPLRRRGVDDGGAE